jgi:hypothetical protein
VAPRTSKPADGTGGATCRGCEARSTALLTVMPATTASWPRHVRFLRAEPSDDGADERLGTPCRGHFTFHSWMYSLAVSPLARNALMFSTVSRVGYKPSRAQLAIVSMASSRFCSGVRTRPAGAGGWIPHYRNCPATDTKGRGTFRRLGAPPPRANYSSHWRATGRHSPRPRSRPFTSRATSNNEVSSRGSTPNTSSPLKHRFPLQREYQGRPAPLVPAFPSLGGLNHLSPQGSSLPLRAKSQHRRLRWGPTCPLHCDHQLGLG